MTANIRVLPTEHTLDQKDAIEVLEEVLAEAREGRVRSVAVAIVRPDWSVSGNWSSSRCGPMVGAITIMQHELIAQGEE